MGPASSPPPPVATPMPALHCLFVHNYYSSSRPSFERIGLRTDSGSKRPDEEEIRTAFMVFDMDCNGLIDAEELRMTMTHLGKVFTETQVEEMIKAVDGNHDGKIDYKGKN